MATYLEQSLEKLKEFEGCVPWMYRDTTGNVTVGIGTMLPNAHAAAALPFEVAGMGISAEQIGAEFSRVSGLPAGRLPQFYRQRDSPQLPMSSVEQCLRSVLVSFETQLRQHLPRYDALPDRAKLALLDMAYNLGVTGLLHGYPRLLGAVAAGNWAEAAGQCFRHGISSERNSWTRLEFLAAATVAGVVDDVKAMAEELRPMLRWIAVAAALGMFTWTAFRVRHSHKEMHRVAPKRLRTDQ